MLRRGGAREREREMSEEREEQIGAIVESTPKPEKRGSLDYGDHSISALKP
jgi:hypothetical protein